MVGLRVCARVRWRQRRVGACACALYTRGIHNTNTYTVDNTSPICNLYRIVVFPAASRPSITTRISFVPIDEEEERASECVREAVSYRACVMQRPSRGAEEPRSRWTRHVTVLSSGKSWDAPKRLSNSRANALPILNTRTATRPQWRIQYPVQLEARDPLLSVWRGILERTKFQPKNWSSSACQPPRVREPVGRIATARHTHETTEGSVCF